jgi:hypothetical protein
MTNLTNTDYKRILEFYKMQIPSSTKQLKAQAEKLLVEHLCRCIKKVDKVNEGRSIGICTKAVINNKGIKRGRFTCKKRPSIVLSKNKSYKNRK